MLKEPLNSTDLMHVDVAWLEKWNRPVPRYTSYPTAPQFHPLERQSVLNQLASVEDEPLSLYIHIPFCKSMCLFCGCSVILNRSYERAQRYLEHLLWEMRLVAAALGRKKRISQLHLGGGTPTSLDEAQLDLLMQGVREHFSLDEDGEVSIEVDPRTVVHDQAKKLEKLQQLGFNRVSFGVQDLDPRVQEAVKRRQSEAMTLETYAHARRLGFQGISIDLIYGLPLQTRESFCKTALTLCALKPDRISLFSYAKVPWLKPHQNAIREKDLPSDLEKFQIYTDTRRTFMEGGYVAIGMDHFALQGDSLAEAYGNGNLIRNFQGYSVGRAEEMLGLGVSSIGFVGGLYLQNVKSLEEYETCLNKGELPIFRGFQLSQEDLLRRWVVQEIMCRFRLEKRAFEERFGKPFDRHFASERGRIEQLISEDLIEETTGELKATPRGRLFVRLIASVFDQYLGKGQFSRVV